MGTRGTTGFIVDGVLTASYQQYDSYPDAVGKDVLNFARTLTDPTTYTTARAQAAKLVAVPENGTPTAAQRAQLSQYTNTNVSSGEDWYSTLRNCQGLPGEILASGFILDSVEAFQAEQFDWQIDFDANVFRGFSGSALLGEYALDALPDDERFLAEMQAATEAAYA